MNISKTRRDLLRQMADHVKLSRKMVCLRIETLLALLDDVDHLEKVVETRRPVCGSSEEV